MQRTVSNDSSASSDIVVAGPPPHASTPSQRSTRQSMNDPVPSPSLHSRRSSAKLTTAFVQWNRLTIRFGPQLAKDRFRAIVRARPSPVSHAFDASSPTGYQMEDEDDSEGPNHRGTYSREYTLLHPDVKWVHRGQGRYLPASAINTEPETSTVRSTRQSSELTNGSVATSEQTMQSMTQALQQHFENFRRKHNPDASDRWSPQLKGQFKLILELIKKTPRQQWSKAISTIRDPNYRRVVKQWSDAMDHEFPVDGRSRRLQSEEQTPRTRLSRQAKDAAPSLEHRRSSRFTETYNSTSYIEDDEDVDGADSNESDDPDKTFSRDYTAARPNEQFHHAGNGWFKRGLRSTELEKHVKRRDSSASHALKYSSSEASRELDSGATIHKDDLHKYPGMTFHHKGNRWYKPGIGPNGVTGSIIISGDGEIIGHKRRRSDLTSYYSDRSSDVRVNEGGDEGHTVNKAYADMHPEIEWVHRGGGRYKRKSSIVNTGTATSAASSDRRSSRAEKSFKKEYAESHTSDETRRPGARRRSSRIDLNDEESSELFDKAYVLAHPDERFYHRGQGRYARGHRSKFFNGAESKMAKGEGLVDSAYVASHPDEWFHHRGQGKWARGLPEPGTSNKIAIRGPGAVEAAELLRTAGDDDSHPTPPSPTALLRKEEGPDLWPNLRWVYRGGGKWCQLTKEEAQRAAMKPHKYKTSGGQTRQGGGRSQLREALAEQDEPSRAGKKAPLFLQRPSKIIRKRSQQNTAQAQSKLLPYTQPKEPAPRPALLAEDEDRLNEEDLPGLYKDEWSDAESEDLDDAAKILRKSFAPLVGAEPFVRALTKYDPAVRSLDTLKKLAENAQRALMQLQDEYLELDELVARNPMQGKKERKPVKGGRQPLDHVAWEDRKEAILYDYTFDPRRIGYQDPDAQKIVRDDEGRELRRRRNRYGHDPHETQVNYGDGEMTAKRAVKPVSRFDGVVIPPPRKRSRLTTTTITDDNQPAEAPSPAATPARALSPIPGLTQADMDWINDPRRGRWVGHVPKAMHQRLRQLRAESVGSQRSEGGSSSNPAGAAGGGGGGGVRKGRPPGSKNLHARKDKGIKKGPRLKKVEDGGGSGFGFGSGSGSGARDTPTSSVEPESMDVDVDVDADGDVDAEMEVDGTANAMMMGPTTTIPGMIEIPAGGLSSAGG